jgi:uncharacterized C2H2 Zn-finger protein
MDSEPYKCSICGMVVVNSNELVSHRNAVHVDSMLQCQACGRFFEGEKEFEKHAIEVHGSASQTASNSAHSLSLDAGEDTKESMLLKREIDQEKARKRSRGPYRKSSIAG